MHPIDGTDSVDSIFQDFAEDGGTVGSLWADVDAAMHSVTDAWMKAKVIRDEDSPYLHIEVPREGYRVNVKIIPKNSVPEIDPGGAKLVFELRSDSDFCVGIRVLDRDDEIWVHGPKHLKYFQQCLGNNHQWKSYQINLQPNADRWFKFI